MAFWPREKKCSWSCMKPPIARWRVVYCRRVQSSCRQCEGDQVNHHQGQVQSVEVATWSGLFVRLRAQTTPLPASPRHRRVNVPASTACILTLGSPVAADLWGGRLLLTILTCTDFPQPCSPFAFSRAPALALAVLQAPAFRRFHLTASASDHGQEHQTNHQD